jgi:phosphoglycolate phosphatase
MTLSPEGAPRFRAVLFDLDGTLADCFQDIQAATNHALRALGLPEHDLAAIKTFVGHGVDHLCQMALGGRVELADEARRHIVAYYASHPASTSRFYEGIPELARDLRAAGVRVGVVSNKVHPLAVKAIEGMGGADWFDAIQGEVAELARKPSPRDALGDAGEAGNSRGGFRDGRRRTSRYSGGPSGRSGGHRGGLGGDAARSSSRG